MNGGNERRTSGLRKGECMCGWSGYGGLMVVF